MIQDPLKLKLHEKADILSEKLNALVKEHGSLKIDEINLGQIVGGMRGVKSMLWETSELDAEVGIKFRGYDIFELRDKLPKAANDTEPLAEGIFWLMLVDEIPTADDVEWLTDQWTRRSVVPEHVYKVIEALPKETHPMTQFSIAISA
ncbi:MAG TPA: citrate/2-methylcitrate synthase, partial [Saprospiraceae bacterium]|nr:citrate/2-methylcitrate synthase [Saprospiraceae bacterium]